MLAIDIGNTRLKWGWFPDLNRTADGLPVAESITAWRHDQTPWDWSPIEARVRAVSQVCEVLITSVYPTGTDLWLAQWRERFPSIEPRVIASYQQLPLRVAVENPGQVGMDRLLDAWGGWCVAGKSQAVLVIDSGTATTANLVSVEGVFQGGAIWPGLELGSKALHDHTALLPQLEDSAWSIPPAVLGVETHGAIASGLFWGQVGAIREISLRLGEQTSGPVMNIITGGAAPFLGESLGPDWRIIPHLGLRGLAGLALVS